MEWLEVLRGINLVQWQLISQLCR